MSRFVINGGKPLQGEITASGSKNAVLPMIAASLLTDEEVVLENVPAIRDVDGMLEILAHLGVDVGREGATLRIRAGTVRDGELPWQLCEKVRTSFLMVAPMLSRVPRVKVCPPGGDGIGRRRLDAHFYGLRLLGVEVDEEEFVFKAPRRLRGRMMFFDEASVTATEHILMAAVLAERFPRDIHLSERANVARGASGHFLTLSPECARAPVTWVSSCSTGCACRRAPHAPRRSARGRAPRRR